MRRIVASLYITLDGVVEDPAWSMPFFNDEAGKIAREQLFASEALLLGRVTYEGFVRAWPSMTDEDGFADRMNRMPKYVATTTLDRPEWNATFLKGDKDDRGVVAAQVAELKRHGDGDLLIYGSGDLVNTLLEHDLIDELRLWTHPVIEGTGKRLFGEGAPKKTLKLVSTKTFSTGSQVLAYAPGTDGS